MFKNYWLRRKAIREDALIIYPETYGVKAETMNKRQLLAQIENLRRNSQIVSRLRILSYEKS